MKYFYKRGAVFVLLIAFLFSASSCKSILRDILKNFVESVLTEDQPKGENAVFENFLWDYYIFELSEDTTCINIKVSSPENYFNEKTKYRLPLCSKNNFDSWIERFYEFKDRLETIIYNKLSDENKLYYDLLLNDFNMITAHSNFFYHFDYYIDSYDCIAQNLPITLSSYTFNDKEDLDNYLELVNSVPEAFNSYLEFENQKKEKGTVPSKTVLDICIEDYNRIAGKDEKNSFIVDINAAIDTFSFLSDEQKSEYKTKNKDAVLNSLIPSYKKLTSELKKLAALGTNPLGFIDMPEGEEFLAIRLKLKSGADIPAIDLMRELRSELSRIYRRMEELEIENQNIADVLSKNVLKENDRATIDFIYESMKEDFPALKKAPQYNIQFYPSVFPSSAEAMYSSSTKTIFVRPDLNVSSLEKYKNLAHEGLPGHMYENLYNEDKNLSYPKNYLFFYQAYTEGWARYTEVYSMKYVVNEEKGLEYAILNAKFNTYEAAALDIGINCLGWTTDNISAFYSFVGTLKHGYYIPDNILKDIQKYYRVLPLQSVPYGVGLYNFELLRQTAQQKMGDDYADLDFHTAVLDAGTMPFKRLEAEVVKRIEPLVVIDAE